MAGPSEAGGERMSSPRWVERWWGGELGWQGRVLDLAFAPTELLFRGAVLLRGVGYDRGLLHTARIPVPIISVGNLAVGGAGKTPVSRWLVAELLRRGERPAVLHGGYAADEPELHRRWHPTIPVMVGRDRVALAGAAVDVGATALVLDDGFQHRRLARDLDLVLVAAEGWTSRPRLLPRGPWREAPTALARAHAVVVTRKVASAETAAALRRELGRYAPGAVIAEVWLRPTGWRRGVDIAHTGDAPVESVPPGEVLAVTAIARPELFVANARWAGAQVTSTLFFPDHHDYHADDLERIRELASGRPIVTTAKDLVKLSALDPTLDLWVLEQEVVVEAGGDELNGVLDRALAGAGRVAR